MTELIALAPTPAEIAKGELKSPLTFAGGGTPPQPDITSSGLDEAGYHFVVQDPLGHWLIPHGLGRYPSVTVQAEDVGAEALNETEALVEHLSVDELRIRFGTPARGIAWLR
jgi:hypothetical protein